jgi:hypothetical protein
MPQIFVWESLLRQILWRKAKVVRSEEDGSIRGNIPPPPGCNHR